MKKRRILKNAVDLLTGKYGILLLTLLNAGLACLIITLSGHWHDPMFSGENADFMTFYLVDYRVGFISRALIGSILYLFTEHPTVRMVSILLFVSATVLLILFAFLQAQIVKKTLLKSDYASLLLSYLFFLNSVFWFNPFACSGLLDVFMIVLMQFYLICLEYRKMSGFWLAPLVCFVGLLIHTAFAFVFIPVIAAILWFELLKQGKPDRVCVTLFVVTGIVSVVLFVIFVFFTKQTVHVSEAELLNMMRQKYAGPIDEDYYSIYLFRSSRKRDGLTENNLLQFLFGVSQTDYTSLKIRRHLFNILLLNIPFFTGCAYHARTSGNRKIAYLGFIAPFVALFPALEFSTDKERFFSLFLLAQYLLLHYLVTQTNNFFLPCAASPPVKILTRYETVRREERIRRALKIGAIAGLIFTLAGTRLL